MTPKTETTHDASLSLANVETVESWQRYVETRDTYRMPSPLSRDEYEALPRRDRAQYDFARTVGISNLPKHETPMAQALRQEVETTLQVNTFRLDPGVRSGVFVSGDSGQGKTTIVREIAASFEDQVRAGAHLVPSLFTYSDLWVPVAWVNVPPKVSIGALCRVILAFFGENPKRHTTDPTLTTRVHELLRDCGTKLLVLDDITRMKMHREADQDAADWVRALQETSATVLGVGVDVEGSGLLYEGQAPTRAKRLLTQTRRRFTVLNLDPFTYSNEADIAAWISHLAAVEADLPLLDKQPGMLSDALPEYLFERTSGVIGSLSTLIAKAAIRVKGRALTNGGEYLTEADFSAVTIDHAAESKHEPEIDAAVERTTQRRRRNGAFNGDGRGQGVA